jgi:catechol 2,3-dioxygenase-like lactoylglutathione lyase family enzyme
MPVTSPSPLWPAQLDHLTRETDKPDAMVAFYRDVVDMDAQEIGPGAWLLQAPGRRIVIQSGRPYEQPEHGYRVTDEAHFRAVKAWVQSQGIPFVPQPYPLFDPGFAVHDPDGRILAIGLPNPKFAAPKESRRPGRLQHMVTTSTKQPIVVDFYKTVGFRVSDNVYRNDKLGVGEVTATFMRSDPEHHSFGAFLAAKAAPDHHSYETGGWLDLRDWSDYVTSRGYQITLGPGRRGCGANLFIMIDDPDGYRVEWSADIELVERDMAPRTWPHAERSLNRWGRAHLRS